MILVRQDLYSGQLETNAWSPCLVLQVSPVLGKEYALKCMLLKFIMTRTAYYGIELSVKIPRTSENVDMNCIRNECSGKMTSKRWNLLVQ